MPFPALMDRTLSPLDELRQAGFRLALRSRVVAALLVRRDRRLALFASLHASLAFALAVYFPVLLFVLGPVLLGVVHVAADVRYLVLRRRLQPWWQSVVVAACVGLVGLGALERLHWLRPSAGVELWLVLLWAALGVVAGAAQSRAWTRAAIALALVLAVGTVAAYFPRGFRLLFLHAHNLVALAIWPLFFRTPLRMLSWLRILVLGAALLLASGVLFRTTLASSGVQQFGVHVLQVSDWVAPVLRADYAIGVTSAFVFLQAVHYAIWLSVIPQAELPGQGTYSFRRSVRSLITDFGRLGLVLLLICVAAVLLYACVDAPRASASYLGLAMFHGYLELVLLLYFWVAGQPLTNGITGGR